MATSLGRPAPKIFFRTGLRIGLPECSALVAQHFQNAAQRNAKLPRSSILRAERRNVVCNCLTKNANDLSHRILRSVQQTELPNIYNGSTGELSTVLRSILKMLLKPMPSSPGDTDCKESSWQLLLPGPPENRLPTWP